MRVSGQLDMAADLIEQRGWTSARLQLATDQPLDTWGQHSEGAPVCLEGAIMVAAGVAETFEVSNCAAYRAVWDYLDGNQGWGSPLDHRLYDWNDREGRTASEVVAVLRAASAVESARESVSVLRMGSVAVQVGGAR